MTSARCKAFFVIPVGLTVDVAPSESKSVTSSLIAFIAKFSFDSGLVTSISSNLLKSIVEKFAKTVSVKLLFCKLEINS